MPLIRPKSIGFWCSVKSSCRRSERITITSPNPSSNMGTCNPPRCSEPHGDIAHCMPPHRACTLGFGIEPTALHSLLSGAWLVPALARIFDKHLDIHHDDVIDASRSELLQELRNLYRDNRMFSVSAAALGSN